MESLGEFLRRNGYDAKDFDGTLKSVWELIEVDKDYYLKKHGEPHRKWAFGLTDTHWRWYWQDSKPSMGWGFNNTYQPGQQIVDALNAASTARFESYGQPKTRTEMPWGDLPDVPF